MTPLTGPCTPPGKIERSSSPAGLLLAGMVLLLAFVAGCTGSGQVPPEAAGPYPDYPAGSGIELVFFHPVPGCESCDEVGLYANETANTYFQSQVAAGNITYRDVNLNLPENRGIADRYGAYTQSLWIGEYDGNRFHATEITDIWYFAYNHDGFLQYLKGILERKLDGSG